MYEIDKLYQKKVTNELQLIENENSLMNKEIIEKKILAFLSELGKVGEESQCFSFWDYSSKDMSNLLEYYLDAMQLLFSIGFDLKVQSLKEYTEIPDQISTLQQFLKVYEGILKVSHSYSFEEYQNCIDDYFTLGFKLGLTFEEIASNYQTNKK